MAARQLKLGSKKSKMDFGITGRISHEEESYRLSHYPGSYL